jgi:transposase
VSWKDVLVPRPYPREFRDDVVRVARNREDGVTIEQTATDFGVHPMTLTKWMRQADIERAPSPQGAPESQRSWPSCDAEIACWSRRTRSCAGPAAYLSQANLPGKGRFYGSSVALVHLAALFSQTVG